MKYTGLTRVSVSVSITLCLSPSLSTSLTALPVSLPYSSCTSPFLTRSLTQHSLASSLTLPPCLSHFLPPSLTLSLPQRQLEAGVAWPTPGTKFWELAPRGTPMPVDVGAGKNSLVQPRDSRCLDIVHFTAELAPIAKVGGCCWAAQGTQCVFV